MAPLSLDVLPTPLAISSSSPSPQLKPDKIVRVLKFEAGLLQVGVGAFLLDDKQQVLMVQEANGILKNRVSDKLEEDICDHVQFLPRCRILPIMQRPLWCSRMGGGCREEGGGFNLFRDGAHTIDWIDDGDLRIVI